MRTIEDRSGAAWDVAVGKESYGTMVLLFSRRGARNVRRITVDAISRMQAETLLRELSTVALLEKLDHAEPISDD